MAGPATDPSTTSGCASAVLETTSPRVNRARVANSRQSIDFSGYGNRRPRSRQLGAPPEHLVLLWLPRHSQLEAQNAGAICTSQLEEPMLGQWICLEES